MKQPDNGINTLEVGLTKLLADAKGGPQSQGGIDVRLRILGVAETETENAPSGALLQEFGILE